MSLGVSSVFRRHIPLFCTCLGTLQRAWGGEIRQQLGIKDWKQREIMFRGYVSLCREMIWPPRTTTTATTHPFQARARQRPANDPSSKVSAAGGLTVGEYIIVFAVKREYLSVQSPGKCAH